MNFVVRRTPRVKACHTHRCSISFTMCHAAWYSRGQRFSLTSALELITTNEKLAMVTS